MKIDHIEFWVGNAKQTAAYLAHKFDFQYVAYAGPETNLKTRVSYLMQQGNIRFLVTSSLKPADEISDWVAWKGDGVRDISFNVEDCSQIYHHAISNGAIKLWNKTPRVVADDYGTVIEAGIGTYGDVVHSIVETTLYEGIFSPGFERYNQRPMYYGSGVGLMDIDHVVANVEKGKLDFWVDYYKRVFGFEQMMHFSESDISTEYSSLRSTVVWDGVGEVVLPINEPADGLRKSQIEEFLDYNTDAGVQHIALRTDDILLSVERLRGRGVQFLDIPKEYYELTQARVNLDLPWKQLANLGILVDKDEQGYLLQIFTEPFGDRPTLFFEIIQREGSQGFGAGNFKALFEAIEKQQEKRGNL